MTDSQAPNDNAAEGNEEPPTLTMDDVIYWMGWHMDSQRRIYDVLLSLLAAQGHGDKAKELQSMHEQGKFLYPPLNVDTD